MASSLTLATALAVGACKSAASDAKGNGKGAYEGDEPGECADGADNDRDGYFDCQDNGCWGSKDCDGYTGPGPGTGGGPGGGPGGTGTGTGAGTGGGTGTGTGAGTACVDPPCDFTSFELDVHFEFDFAALNEILGLCDCYMDFHSTGVYETYDASTDRVEFIGDWVRTDPGPPPPAGTATGTGTGIFQACVPNQFDPCKDFVANGIWQTEDPVFHSFIFDNSAAPNAVKDWITYEFPGAYYPSADPLNAHQFYITNLWAAYDHSQASPATSAQVLENDPGGQFTVVIDWDVTFEK